MTELGVLTLKDVVQVGATSAQPGSKAYGIIRVGEMADGTPIEIPVIVVNGTQPGPTLYLQAACHGEEINGTEVIRRVLAELDPRKLSGAIIAVPAANILAFRYKQNYALEDMENMNRVFPGRPDGTISEQMAYALWTNCVKDKADYVIDLHTGSRTMTTFTYIEYGEEDVYKKSGELAKIFGTELLVKEVRDEEWVRKRYGGKLRNVCNDRGIPSVTPELDGRRSFDEIAIQVGFRGCKNILKHVGMLDGKPELPEKQITLKTSLSDPKVIATRGGVFIPTVKLGDKVLRGQEVGQIYSVRTLEVVETIKAPMHGIVYSLIEHPIINGGVQVVKIGVPLG